MDSDELIDIMFDKIVEDTEREFESSILGPCNNCISVSLFAATILELNEIEAKPVECCASLLTHPSANIGHRAGSPNITDYGGWHGHVVILLPKAREILDLSLCFQEGSIGVELRKLSQNNKRYYKADLPNVLEVDQTISLKVGSGNIRWNLYKENSGWKKLNWDLEQIKNFAKEENAKIIQNHT